MTDLTLREYTPGDVPALSLLWREVFGDPLRMTAEFYALLPDMGSCVVAEREGKLLGAASVLNGFELVTRQRRRPIVGYLYGVMVRESERGKGIGRALTLEAAELARRRESELLCTLPAERSLYGWYHGLLGFECVLHRRRFETGCAPRVYYRNIPGKFIAGTVYDPEAKEVVIGARVRCLNGGKLYMSHTDEYGDFWFKDLAVGVYDVYVEAKGYKTKAFTGLRTRECVNLGDIALEKE